MRPSSETATGATPVSVNSPVPRAARSSAPSAVTAASEAPVVGAHDHGGRRPLGGEGVGDAVQGRDLRDVLGQRVEVRAVDLQAEGGDRQQPDDERGGAQGEHRAADHRRQDPPAEAALADPGVEPPQQRHPRPVDPAAELDQQGGQHRDRAEHGDRDHDDGAGGEGVEGGRAHDVQTGERGDDGATGDQDGVAGRGRRDLDGVEGGPAAGPFLALALEVEERVVDADRHPDEHDHAGDGGLGVHEVGQGRGDADGGRDAGGGEEHRDAGGDEGPEGQQHQAQRDGHREHLGPTQVLRHPVVDGGVQRDPAGLGHAQVGVGVGDVGRDLLERRDVVGVGGEEHLDQQHRAVRAPDRLRHAVDGVEGAHPTREPGAGVLGRRLVEGAVGSVDDDALAVRPVEAAVVDEGLRASGLADAVVLVGGARRWGWRWPGRRRG